MNRQSAIKLLDDTFNQDFNINNYIKFIKELFNKFTVNQKSWNVWKEYEEYIGSYQLIGSYSDNKDVIDVLVVKLKKASSRDRARTMQRNFIAKYLGNANKNGALVAFYGDDIQDWRFSFVKMEYNLVKDKEGNVKPVQELTPAKRYSFLVGVNEPNHTCASQFLKLIMEEEINPSLLEIENAFSIDNVTKEFFNEYKELFLELEESLRDVISKDRHIKEEFKNKEISSVDFAKKLLGQIVFIYFLQKKGWLGVEIGKEWGKGPKDFMRRFFGGGPKNYIPLVSYDNFFDDVLEPLFYDALANPRDGDDGYYHHLKCKIPFLNGGLFEPINDYDWIGTKITLDNNIFDRILKTFDQFNFTVKEDEPLEKEVAVDPEMLGKVFENLLEVKDRKSKGAFYTPREIVHYMCQQSLINYLETNTSIERKDIEKFIQLGDVALDMIIKEQEQIKKYGRSYDINEQFVLPVPIKESHKDVDRLLKEIKVVDPAVGSGAFPIGMLNEIVKARSILSIYFEENRNDYDLKREIIENCLYGVDIESSAVDITKLRFWLSLIVDEMDMKNIKPLPNLDYKIMCGNSLLEEFEGVKLFNEKLLGEVKKDNSVEIKQIENEIKELEKEKGLLANGEKSKFSSSAQIKRKITQCKTKIKELNTKEVNQVTLFQSKSEQKLNSFIFLQKQLFNEQRKGMKKELRAKIDQIEWDLIEETLKEQGNEDAMQKLKEYKKNKSKPFFLWKLYFAEVFQRENPGFDVVIANPPYDVLNEGNVDKLQKNFNQEIRDNNQFSYSLGGKLNLYRLFIEKGYHLNRELGSLTFIVPSTILADKSTIGIRSLLKEKTKLNFFIEFPEKTKVFENVTQATTIFSFRKDIGQKDFLLSVDCQTKYLPPQNAIRTNWNEIKTISGNDLTIPLAKNKKEYDILKKIHNEKISFEEIVYFKQGDINLTFHKKYLSDVDTGFILVRGIHISRFRVDLSLKNKDRRWFDFEEMGNLEDKNKINIISKEMQNERIVCQQISNMGLKKRIICDIIPKNIIVGNSANYIQIKNENWNLKAVFGILMSSLINWRFKKTSTNNHVNVYELECLPFINLSLEQQKPFINLVNQILSITKDNDYLDNPDKQSKVKRLEKEIDELVYKLYELTPEEIKIVEEFNEK